MKYVLFIVMYAVLAGFSQTENEAATSTLDDSKITFIELGSVKCIPCQKMQGIIKNIENHYSSSVEVIFYDVWTPEGKPFARKYKINLIPTQVFLDRNGKEFFRHEGYFPEEEVIKILERMGVKPNS